MRNTLLLVSLAAATLAATGPSVAAGNPASDYCLSRGGKIEPVAGANGGERSLCVLPGGTRIEQWTYFRNTHRITH